MFWKTWGLPALCTVMLLINGSQFFFSLTGGQSENLLGQGLMTLVWLVLMGFSLRYGSFGKKKDKDEKK